MSSQRVAAAFDRLRSRGAAVTSAASSTGSRHAQAERVRMVARRAGDGELVAVPLQRQREPAKGREERQIDVRVSVVDARHQLHQPQRDVGVGQHVHVTLQRRDLGVEGADVVSLREGLLAGLQRAAEHVEIVMPAVGAAGWLPGQNRREDSRDEAADQRGRTDHRLSDAVVRLRSSRALLTMSLTSRISVGTWYGTPSLIVHSMPPPCTDLARGSFGRMSPE
jgi:hypothetical protein